MMEMNQHQPTLSMWIVWALSPSFEKMATTHEPIKERESTKAYNTQYWACMEQIQHNSQEIT